MIIATKALLMFIDRNRKSSCVDIKRFDIYLWRLSIRVMDNLMNANEWKWHAFTQNVDHKTNLLSGTQGAASPSRTDIPRLPGNPSSGREGGNFHAHETPFKWNSVLSAPWPWQPAFRLRDEHPLITNHVPGTVCATFALSHHSTQKR